MALADGLTALGLNIVGGILAAFVMVAITWLFARLRARRFCSIFGHDKAIRIIYGPYAAARCMRFVKPPSRMPRPQLPAFNLSTVVSGAGIRGVSHLAYAFGLNMRRSPAIEADTEHDDMMNISFVATGGRNYRSHDVLEDANNVFLTFDHDSQNRLAIVSRHSQFPFVNEHDTRQGCDFGLIVKIHPSHNPSLIWMCCGGFGESGTSGASWFLANRWNDIYKFAGAGPFAVITRTRIGSDDSTTIFKEYRFRTAQEVVAAEGKSAQCATTPAISPNVPLTGATQAGQGAGTVP